MAELVLKVKAEYESAVACREELKKVEQQMKQLNENSSAQEIERLTKRYAELTAKWENSMSFIGKTGVFFKEAFQNIGKTIKDSADSMQDLGNTTKSVIDAAQKRLQLEENIRETLKRQREEAEKTRHNAAEGVNRNRSKLSALEDSLRVKYNSQSEDYYSEADIALLEKGRSSVSNWTKEWDDANTKIMVFDQLMEESTTRTEKLSQTIGEMSNVYKGFADTVESSSTKVFISEDVFNRYHELSRTIENLKQQIKDVGDTDDVDYVKLQGLQDELAKSQEEFRALDQAARNTAEVLGGSLASRVSSALNNLYNLTSSIKNVNSVIADLEQKMRAAKTELAEAKDPAAITKARQEIDTLQVKLDAARDSLSKFKAEQKDAVADVERLSKNLENAGNPSEGQDIAGAVSSQAKELMGKVAAITGIGLGLNELTEFFSKAKEWREYFQDIESSMKVFLGSAEKGADFTAKLKDYAYYNMFEFSDLAAASQQMISYGHNVESIIPRLDQLSNVATGTHGSLMELVDTYNRAKATGVVDARGIQSWAVKGVMIKDVLRDMGEVTAGTTVTFEQLNKVLDHITGEGGQFHGLMLEMMDNISAESGQLEDNLAAMYEEIGSKFEGVFVKWLKLQSAMAGDRNNFISDELLDFGAEKANEALDYLLENWQSVINVIKDAVVVYGTYRASLIAVNAAEKAWTAWQGFKKAAILGNSVATTKEALAKAAETAAETANTTAKNVNTGATNANSASMGANAAATAADTAAKGANATATVLLGHAWKTLSAAMMANPIGLIAAGITAVAYACYAAYDGIMTQEKAQRLLNGASEDYNDQVKEQMQKDKDNIVTIQNKTASLLEQTKAYKALIRERAVFANYTKDEIQKMSSDQIDNILSRDNSENNEERLRNQVKAAEELQKMFAGKSAAWLYAEDDDIDKVVAKYGLLPEYADRLKESIGGFTDLSDWAGQLLISTGDELRAHLEENTRSGIVEGFKSGFANPELQNTAMQAIDDYTSEMSKASAKIEEDIEKTQNRLRKIDNGTEIISNPTERTRTIAALNKKLEELGASITKVRANISETFVKQMQPQVDAAKERVEELNRQLLNASESKKAEIETKLKDAGNDLDTLKSIMSFFESGVTNKDLVIDVKAEIDDALLGDDKLIEIGDVYTKLDDAATKYLEKFEDVRSEMQEFASVSKEEAEEIADKHGFTAEMIESEFKGTYDTISSEIQALNSQLTMTTDPSKQRKINLEIAEKQKQLDYIDNIKTQLLSLANNPYEIRLKFKLEGEKWLKNLLGIQDEEKNTPNKNFSFGGNDFLNNSMKRLGIQNDASVKRQQSEEAKRKAEEAKERNKPENKPETKSGKQFTDEDKATRKQMAKQYNDLINGRGIYNGLDYSKLSREEYDKEMQKLKPFANDAKKGESEAKKRAAKNAKEIADELKHQEKMASLLQDWERKRTDASIAAIENNEVRERKAREEQHRRTIEDLEDYQDIYKEIYSQRKADYENKNSEKGLKYENTAAGAAGFVDPKAQENILKTLTDKEREYYDIQVAIRKAKADEENENENRRLAEESRSQMEAMRNYLKEYGTFQQQKLAIAEEYAEKIREAQKAGNVGEVLELREKQKKAEADVEYKAIEMKIDWYSVFDNMGLVMKGALEEQMNMLKEYIKTPQFQQLQPEQKQTVVNAMSNIRQSIGSVDDLGFRDLAKAVREYQAALQEQRVAEEAYNKAVEEYGEKLAEAKKRLDAAEKGGKKDEIDSAQKEVGFFQGKLNEAGKTLTDANKNVKASGTNLAVTTKDVTKPVSEITAFLQESGIPQLGQLFSAFDQLKGGVEGLKALKEIKGDEMKKAGEELAKKTSDAGGKVAEGAKEGSKKLSETLGKAGFIAQIVSAVLSILDILKDGIGTLISSLIDTILNAVNGILSNLLSGDFVLQIGNSLKNGVGNLFSTLTFGAIPKGFDWSKDTREQVDASINASNKVIENIDKNVEKIRESMGDSYGARAISEYEKLLGQQRNKYGQYNAQIQDAGSGYYGHSHSEWYYRNENGGEGAGGYVDRIRRLLGIAQGGYGTAWQGFFNQLSDMGDEGARKLALLRENAEKYGGEWAELWHQINETGWDDEGRISRAANAWADIVKQMDDDLEKFNEIITTTTREGILDDALGYLYDFADGADDVFDNIAENWQKMVNRMVINNSVASDLQKKLQGDKETGEKGWYDRLAEVNRIYALSKKTDADRKKYQDELKKLREEYDSYVTEGRQQIEDYRDAGLIQSLDKARGQNATFNSAQNITYEQADTLTGIELAKQIILEQILRHMDEWDDRIGTTSIVPQSEGADNSLLSAKADQLLYIGSEQRDIASDSRDILAGMAIHIEEIRDGVVDTIVPRIKNIDTELTKVRRAVEER